MKKVLLIIVAALAALLVQSLLAIATGEPLAVLGLTALFTAFCYATYRFPEQMGRRRWVLVPVILVLAAVVMTATASAGRGGITVNPEIGTPRTCTTARVWHTGHAPVGGYVAYRFNLRVYFCRTLSGRIVNLAYKTYWSSERSPADIVGVTARSTQRYGCRIDHQWVPKGCASFYRKGKVVYSYPALSSIFTAYPWVRMKITGDMRSPVVYWGWSRSIF